jgi:uncharacterized protein YeaO (DUF488 family)
MPIAVKRAYDKPALSDGTRVLVDRLWPRGLTKSQARIDEWLKGLSPSETLRKWYHGGSGANWNVFRKRYLKELAEPQASAELERLYELARQKQRLTLVFSSKNTEQNNATVLKELLEGMRKPPSSSGPAGAAVAIRSRAAKK